MVAQPHFPASTGAAGNGGPGCRVGSSSPTAPPSSTSPTVAAEPSSGGETLSMGCAPRSEFSSLSPGPALSASAAARNLLQRALFLLSAQSLHTQSPQVVVIPLRARSARAGRIAQNSRRRCTNWPSCGTGKYRLCVLCASLLHSSSSSRAPERRLSLRIFAAEGSAKRQRRRRCKSPLHSSRSKCDDPFLRILRHILAVKAAIKMSSLHSDVPTWRRFSHLKS